MLVFKIRPQWPTQPKACWVSIVQRWNSCCIYQFGLLQTPDFNTLNPWMSLASYYESRTLVDCFEKNWCWQMAILKLEILKWMPMIPDKWYSVSEEIIRIFWLVWVIRWFKLSAIINSLCQDLNILSFQNFKLTGLLFCRWALKMRCPQMTKAFPEDSKKESKPHRLS